jgi:hypothetical protein
MDILKKTNVDLRFTALNQTRERGDFFPMAGQLMKLATTMKTLDTLSPAKGSKEEWDDIHEQTIKAAFHGIAACGEEDLEKLKMSLDEISELMRKGHRVFYEVSH